MVAWNPPESRLSSLSVLLLLAGCHVFEDVQVTCTSDMPCANPDTDTDDTGDPDTGDTDTGPSGDPVVGWVTSMRGGERGIIRVFDPVTSEVEAEWSVPVELAGAPYYEPWNRTGLLVGVGGLYTLDADGGTTRVNDVGAESENYDTTRLGRHLLVAYQGGLQTLSADLAEIASVLESGSLSEIRYVGGSENRAFFVDPSAGGPDLWTVDGDGNVQLVKEDYDTSLTRATNVFVGPEEAPFACSPAGAVYSINKIIGGDARPVAYHDDDFADVSDCAYDPGDGSFLIYSASRGVFRIDEGGRADQVSTPSTGYVYARVFWTTP